MLNEIRKPGRAKNFIAYILFGAIILVFALFGLNPDRLGPSAGGAAAVVNDQVISLVDFRERVQRVEQQVKMDTVPEAQKQNVQQMIRRRALEELISLEVLAQSARGQGVWATDFEVRDRIGQIPTFQEEGRFKRDLYTNYLNYARLSPADFENKVRKDIAVNRMQSLFVRAAQPVAGEDLRDAELSETKMDLKYVSFDQDELQQSIKFPSKEISAYLAKPEVSARLKSYYEGNQAEFTTPEEVKARHILIRPDTETKITDRDAKKKAEDLLARLEKGEDFKKLAKEFSDDPVSAKEGGDLGFFSRGRMVPEFENFAFKLEPGKTSPVFKSQFGYHILKVDEKRAAKTKSFEEVAPELARREMAKEATPKTLAELTKLVKDANEKGLDAELKNLGLEWLDTGDFDLATTTIPGIGENEKVLNAVVQRGGKPGLIPNMMESQGRYFLVKLAKIELPKSEQLSTSFMQSRMIASRRSNEILNTWVRKEREGAEIKRNLSLLGTVNQ